jgi:hypothetical protein
MYNAMKTLKMTHIFMENVQNILNLKSENKAAHIFEPCSLNSLFCCLCGKMVFPFTAFFLEIMKRL